MTPTAPGVYTLILPSGKAVARRVRDVNGEMRVNVPRGFLGLLAVSVPVGQVEGKWSD